MGVHARLSASKTKEWSIAPGIIALHERFPVHDPSGEAAQMGTCVHDLVERCLRDGQEPSEYLGRIATIINPETPQEGVSILRKGAKTPKNGVTWFELDQELIDAATCMTDYVRMRQAKMNDAQLTVEYRTNPLPDRDDTGGTADVTLADLDEDFGGEIEVIDYKNGTGVLVPVEDNKQLMSYLLGRTLDLIGEISDDYSYRMTIVQPRHHLTPDDGVLSVPVTAQELRDFEQELRHAVDQVDRGRVMLDEMFKMRNSVTLEECIDVLDAAGLLEVAGFGNDTIWDPYLKIVPSNQRLTEAAADIDFADDPPDEFTPPETPEQLARLLKWAPHIKRQIKHAEAEAERILREGGSVEGFKLVRKQANRQWKPEVRLDERTAEEIAKKYGANADDLLTDPVGPRLRTGPQVLAKIPKAQKAAFENAYIHRPDGELAMVDSSDKRQAVNPMEDAADDFDDDDDV